MRPRHFFIAASLWFLAASYFVDPISGAHAGDIFQWSARYTPETITAQVSLAKSAGRRMRIIERWLPLALAAAGLVWLATTFFSSSSSSSIPFSESRARTRTTDEDDTSTP